MLYYKSLNGLFVCSTIHFTESVGFNRYIWKLMLTGNPVYWVCTECVPSVYWVCVCVCVCVWLPDTDSSSEDELSLCCRCTLLNAEPFPLGTASVEEERHNKAKCQHFSWSAVNWASSLFSTHRKQFPTPCAIYSFYYLVLNMYMYSEGLTFGVDPLPLNGLYRGWSGEDWDTEPSNWSKPSSRLDWLEFCTETKEKHTTSKTCFF